MYKLLCSEKRRFIVPFKGVICLKVKKLKESYMLHSIEL